ncbi:hypothetical protein ACFOOK_31940 [Micromonospora krabiensis]|uniref:Uncharacterized protein n=1 Tax=Micromonospora krabiensis TaxID=307121 RepID=A0A1C3MYA5_9ACTN|nr:hypothetical protein [Micromonospora krabiensis]SBV25313.1 hypothetical protein GA0070620_0785 [Micromonospora krabiensis]
MTTRRPLDPSERAEFDALAPHPGDRDLPAGRHQLHRDRLLATIARETRADARPSASAPRRAPRRPTLAVAALVLVVAGLGAGFAAGTRGGAPTALPSAALPADTTTAPTAAAGPKPAAKGRAYGTVRQLTDGADLVVRGDVVSVSGVGGDRRAVYRVDEVLHGAAPVTVGGRITVVAPEVPGTSRLDVGQPTVLYLALRDPHPPAYAPLGGDVGIFDVAGETVRSRSAGRSVSGLRDEEATGQGRVFVATLAELRRLAGER